MKKFMNAELVELDLSMTEKNKNNKNFTEEEKRQGYKALSNTEAPIQTEPPVQTEPAKADDASVTNLFSGE